ncbi:MAG: thiamine-phosphate kinase [Gemmataceae bacterium]
MGEFDYIRRLRRRIAPDPRVQVGPGDDCAVLTGPGGAGWIATTDMLMDGVDFLLDEVGPRRAGRKAMAANLSDIAAMAGRPVAAVVSVALPRHASASFAEELFFGLKDCADEFQTAIVGGDTNVWDGRLALSVTVMGEPGPAGAILRSGARPGDRLLVTGPLGGSILGKHLDFTPRVREGLLLAEMTSLHALIDISDGLAADANHIGEESGCGIVLRAATIPIAPSAYQAGGKTPLERALSDGEDFELLFAVTPEEARRLLDLQPLPEVTVYEVGECVAGTGLYLEDGGKRRPLEPVGFVHQTDA